MKSIQLKSILALFLTGILVWTGCKKKEEEPQPVGPSITSFTATSTPAGTTSGDTLKVNVGAVVNFTVKVGKGNTSKDKVLKQFKYTVELIGSGLPPVTFKDTTYAENLNKDNITYNLTHTPASSGVYKYVYTISDYNNKTATKTYFVKSGTPCSIGVSVTSVAADSLTVTVAGSGLTSGGYEYSFNGGTTWSSTPTHTFTSTGSKTILVRSASTPTCASSTTFNVTGKKLKQKTGVVLGDNTSTTQPSLYDVEGETTYTLSSSAGNESKIDFVFFSGMKLQAPDHTPTFSIVSGWAGTNKMPTKFYNIITSTQYDNANTNADIISLKSGAGSSLSSSLTTNSGFVFETFSSTTSTTPSARGVLLVTNTTSNTVTFKVKYYKLN